jgi:hypothetical protein
MVVMKLPYPSWGGWIPYVLVLVANLGAVAVVLLVLARHFTNQPVTTKRAFEPKSLIGTTVPASQAGD